MFRVLGLRCRVLGLGFCIRAYRVWRFGFCIRAYRVWRFGFWVLGTSCRGGHGPRCRLCVCISQLVHVAIKYIFYAI